MPDRDPKTVQAARDEAAEHYGFMAGAFIQWGIL